MPGEGKAKKKRPSTADQGEHQTNLAEGEPDIVDESIRIHEQKKDEQGRKKKE